MHMHKEVAFSFAQIDSTILSEDAQCTPTLGLGHSEAPPECPLFKESSSISANERPVPAFCAPQPSNGASGDSVANY
jgi:hypothetical protein